MAMKFALLCTVVALLQLEVTSIITSGWPEMCAGIRVIMEEPPCPRSLGLSSYKPAKSCREILQCNPSARSGYYWLKSTSSDSQEVYCAMDTTYCNITGGWMRLAYFNMTEPGVSCPTSLRQINTPAKLCGRTSTGC